MNEMGWFVIGEYIGFREEPWATDPSKFNRQIGIKVGEYDKGFGEMATDVVRVDVFDQPALDFIRSNGEKLKGKQVKVCVVPNARPGKKGPWLSVAMPRGALPQLVSPVTKAA
jgi:hypothetical protein